MSSQVWSHRTGLIWCHFQCVFNQHGKQVLSAQGQFHLKTGDYKILRITTDIMAYVMLYHLRKIWVKEVCMLFSVAKEKERRWCVIHRHWGTLNTSLASQQLFSVHYILKALSNEGFYCQKVYSGADFVRLFNQTWSCRGSQGWCKFLYAWLTEGHNCICVRLCMLGQLQNKWGWMLIQWCH